MNITYHMVPKSYYEAHKGDASYLPAAFADDGFIHCTDGEFMISQIAFRVFRELQEELWLFFIDKSRVKSAIRYDDKERLFPHIYGPLNWDAVVKVGAMVRDRKGDWIFPINEKI